MLIDKGIVVKANEFPQTQRTLPCTVPGVHDRELPTKPHNGLIFPEDGNFGSHSGATISHPPTCSFISSFADRLDVQGQTTEFD